MTATLDEPSSDDGLTYAEELIDPDEDVQSQLTTRDFMAAIRYSIDDLPKNQRIALTAESLIAAANALGLTASRACQLRQEALTTLRNQHGP